MALDERDRAILRQLQLNARLTHAEIGEKVGLSPSACHRRIRILEAEGYIRAYTIILNKSENGGVTMLVQVTLERQTEDCLSRFERAVRLCPEVKECVLIAGTFDYWLRVETENSEAYERIHGEVLSRLPGVMRINSSFAMRDVLGQKRKAGVA